MRVKTVPLLRQALAKRSRVALDLAFDLMVLPLSYVALNVSAFIVLALAAAAIEPQLFAWVWIGVACGVALVLHILRGWQLSGAGAQGLLDLARAPFFLFWKIVVMMRGGESKEWVRTKREGTQPPPPAQ